MGCGPSIDHPIVLSEHPQTKVVEFKNLQQQSQKKFTHDYRAILKEFNSLQNSIRSLEESKCFEKYRVFLEELEQLNARKTRTIQRQSDCLQKIYKYTERHGLSRDVSLRHFVADKWIQKTTQLTENDVELIEALSLRETLDTTKELLSQDIEHLHADAEAMKSVCGRLQNFYEKRDNLLNDVFDGTYGSEQELGLERELENLFEERHFIECAKLRWMKANRIIHDAMDNLKAALEMLDNYENSLENDIDARFMLIQEARNSLHLYSYNLKTMKSILLNLNLPHTKSDDLDRLDSIVDRIFVLAFEDAQIQETVAFLERLQRQTSTQHKWIKEVLSGTIKRDLNEIREQSNTKANELHSLRNFLIEKQSRNAQETEVKKLHHPHTTKKSNGNRGSSTNDDMHESPIELRVDSGVDSELDESVFITDVPSTAARTVVNSGTDSELSTTTPLLPGEELGPIPSDNEIFGKIIQLRRQHSQEMEDFEAAQNLNRAKVSQSLKDKLNDRRSRRYRMEMHRRQLEALQELPSS